MPSDSTTLPNIAPGLGEFSQLSSVAYKISGASQQITAPAGFTLLMQSDSKLSDGFAAVAFQDMYGNIIIAYEGTVPGISAYSRGTFSADAALLLGNDSSALQDARDFAQNVYNMYGNGGKIYVTGHSLGGAEAEAACKDLGVNKCAGGVTFAAPGLPKNDAGAGLDSGLVDYVEYGDPIANYATDNGGILKNLVHLVSGDIRLGHYGTVCFVGNVNDANVLIAADAEAYKVESFLNGMIIENPDEFILGNKLSIGIDIFGSNLKFHDLSQYAKDISAKTGSFVPISVGGLNLGLDYAILPLSAEAGAVDSYTQMVDADGNITEIATDGSDRFVYLDGRDQTVTAGIDTRDFIFGGYGNTTINGRAGGTAGDGIVDVLVAGPGDQATGDAMIDQAMPMTVINAEGGSNILIGSKGVTEFKIDNSQYQVGTNVIYGGGGTVHLNLTGSNYRIVVEHVDKPDLSALSTLDLGKLTQAIDQQNKDNPTYAPLGIANETVIVLINPTADDQITLNGVTLTGASYQQVLMSHAEGAVNTGIYKSVNDWMHFIGEDITYHIEDDIGYNYVGNDGQNYKPMYDQTTKTSELILNGGFSTGMFGPLDAPDLGSISFQNFFNGLAGININGDGTAGTSHSILRHYNYLTGPDDFQLRYGNIRFDTDHFLTGPFYYDEQKPGDGDKFIPLADDTVTLGDVVDQRFFMGGVPTLDLAMLQADQATPMQGMSATLDDMSTENIVGNGNRLTVGNNDRLTLSGGMNGVSVTGDESAVMVMGTETAITVTGDRDTVRTIGADLDAVIAGQNESLQSIGTGKADVNITGDEESLSLGQDMNRLVLQGGQSNIAITRGNGDITVNGADDTLSIAGAGTVTAAITGDGAAFYGDQSNTVVSAVGSFGQFYAGSGTTAITVGGDENRLFGGTGMDRLTVEGARNQLIAGSGQDSLTANGTGNLLVAAGGVDDLTAIGTGNMLVGGTGTGTLVVEGDGNSVMGNGGQDEILALGNQNSLIAGTGQDDLRAFGTGTQFYAGTGTTRIENHEDGDAPTANLFLGAGLGEQNIWLMQTGSDLLIEQLGTQNRITVADYFTSPQSSLATIVTADHVVLTGTDVAQLVQAMAAFAADNVGFDPTASGLTTLPPDAALQQVLAVAHH